MGEQPTAAGEPAGPTLDPATPARATGHDSPGDPMAAMADLLAACGLAVSTTGCPDSSLLKVTGTGNAACDVSVDEDWYFTCEYTPGRNSHRSPAGTAGVVAWMLGADYASPRQFVHLHQGVTPAGAVGREMKARGMTVTLDVMPDEETFSAFAAIAVTNPACPGRGAVNLEKNWVCWECHGHEIPGGPAELARTVAAVLTPHEPALAEVQQQFPTWQSAQGISGMYYACHPATGRQVTGEDPQDLRDQILAAEARRAATPPGGPGPLYQPGQL